MKAAPFVGERVGSKANQQGERREMCGRVNAIKAQKCALISGFNMAYRRLAKRRNNFVTVASNDVFFVAVIEVYIKLSSPRIFEGLNFRDMILRFA